MDNNGISLNAGQSRLLKDVLNEIRSIQLDLADFSGERGYCDDDDFFVIFHALTRYVLSLENDMENMKRMSALMKKMKSNEVE